jgi:sec-independent protein translocase protein TatB
MLENLSWAHVLVLLVVGVLVLGPERLPGAIRWTADALRKVRSYIAGATVQLRDEFGPEFDDIREPLDELRRLRAMTPRAVVTKHLFDGDESLLTAFDPHDGPAVAAQAPTVHTDPSPAEPQAAARRSAPFDTDAT